MPSPHQGGHLLVREAEATQRTFAEEAPSDARRPEGHGLLRMLCGSGNPGAFDALNRQWAAVGVMRDASGDLRHGELQAPSCRSSSPDVYLDRVAEPRESGAPHGGALGPVRARIGRDGPAGRPLGLPGRRRLSIWPSTERLSVERWGRALPRGSRDGPAKARLRRWDVAGRLSPSGRTGVPRYRDQRRRLREGPARSPGGGRHRCPIAS